MSESCVVHIIYIFAQQLFNCTVYSPLMLLQTCTSMMKFTSSYALFNFLSILTPTLFSHFSNSAFRLSHFCSNFWYVQSRARGWTTTSTSLSNCSNFLQGCCSASPTVPFQTWTAPNQLNISFKRFFDALRWMPSFVVSEEKFSIKCLTQYTWLSCVPKYRWHTK